MAGRNGGKKATDAVVPLPRLAKAQSAPQLHRQRKSDPVPLPKAAKQEARSKAQPLVRQEEKPQPALLTYQMKQQVLVALADPRIREVAKDLYKKTCS